MTFVLITHRDWQLLSELRRNTSRRISRLFVLLNVICGNVFRFHLATFRINNSGSTLTGWKRDATTRILCNDQNSAGAVIIHMSPPRCVVVSRVFARKTRVVYTRIYTYTCARERACESPQFCAHITPAVGVCVCARARPRPRRARSASSICTFITRYRCFRAHYYIRRSAARACAASRGYKLALI